MSNTRIVRRGEIKFSGIPTMFHGFHEGASVNSKALTGLAKLFDKAADNHLGYRAGDFLFVVPFPRNISVKRVRYLDKSRCENS